VRPGIRLQLIFALGALLVLAFVPLFFAVASLTRATMLGAREASARALGRAVAGHVMEARAHRSGAQLVVLLNEQIGRDGVVAIGVYDGTGLLVEKAGDDEAARALPPSVELGSRDPARAPEVLELARVRAARGPAVLVVARNNISGGAPHGAAAVIVSADSTAVPSPPLVPLVALYTGVVALALLVFAYASITRLIVRPIDQLSRAAGRVADGARALDVPKTGARELVDLGSSLSRMTERLRTDEEALRAKIAEVERYAADLKSAQQRLIRSERLASVGRLAAGLAHEIGNPIAAILGFQELLLDGGLDEKDRRDFLERMRRETERIHRVLRDILDFARPSMREPASGIPARPGSVASAAEDALSLIRPQKSSKGVDFIAEIPPDLPHVVLPHESLVQIILNLLLNAVDEIPKPTGRVRIRAFRRPDAMVRIEVEDNGRGIAPNVRDTLFEPFVTTKDVGKGTGLGLSVCRGLVEAAGGTIAADDSDLGGARFIIDLPEAS
jgi:signal transduction histidine kinase